MPTLSLELISYQNNDPFPQALTALTAEIYSDIDGGKYLNNTVLLSKSSYGDRLTKLIRKRFNLNVVMDPLFHEYLPAAIIPFMSDYLTDANRVKSLYGKGIFKKLFGGTDIFTHVKSVEKEKEAYYKSIHNRTGFINLKQGMVGGYLSEVKHYLILNFFVLKAEGLTPEEVTAIILHEIGHAFNGLETHHRLTTTNATMMDILSDINDNKTDKAYYTFKRHFDPKDLEKAQLGGKADVTDFYGKLARSYLGELNSQLANSKYDETNYENLSDSFATRFNVGGALTTGLHKLHVNYGQVLRDGSGVYTILFTIDVFLIMLLIALTGVFGVAFCVTVMLLFAGNKDGVMTYDFPVERYQRIMNGIVNQLKNPHLPKTLAADLLEQHDLIQGIIQESVYFKGVIPMAADYLRPTNRENAYYIKLQQDIENNLNNILFVSSWKVALSPTRT